MRNSPLFSILGILVLLVSSARPVFFQKVEFDGKNACVYFFPNPAVKIWQQTDNLTSTPFTREMKECGFYCPQDPNCAAFQILRTYSGKGFCYIYEGIHMALGIFSTKMSVEVLLKELFIIFIYLKAFIITY